MIKNYTISIKLLQINVLHDQDISTISENIDPKLEKMLLSKCKEPSDVYNDLEDAVSLNFLYLLQDKLKVGYKNNHLIIEVDTAFDSTALFAQLLNTNFQLAEQLHQCNYTSGQNNFHFIQMSNDIEIKID